MRIALIAKLFCFAVVTTALAARPETRGRFQENFGDLQLGANLEHVAWPKPESLFANLHSEDDAIRLNALQLIGLTSNQAHNPNVIRPDVIRLMYAALDSDATQQAIIAIEHDHLMIYVAVGSPTSKGWERVAMFACWPKYSPSPEDFVQLHRASIPNNDNIYELVLRPSGGGSGFSVETEVHLRVRNREIRRVLSFDSRRSSSNAGFSGACKRPNATINCASIERRSLIGTILVEGRGEFDPGPKDLSYPGAVLTQDCHFQRVTCRPYKWNDEAFRYAPNGPAKPCPTIGAE